MCLMREALELEAEAGVEVEPELEAEAEVCVEGWVFFSSGVSSGPL